MDAVQYLKTLRRMCNCECRECELGKRLGVLDTCALWQKANPEEAVAILEQWAKEHPVKTRQSVFLEQWLNAEFDCQGVIAIDPCYVDKTMYGKDGDCYNGECDDCRRKFWLAEVENAETK